MSTLLATPILRLRTGPNAGKVYDVRSALRLGRHPYNEVSFEDPAVSRYHCWITLSEGKALVEDLASANGTFLNGERVAKRVPLKAGDVLRIGSTEVLFAEDE
ncbi:MAG TPA: FHA domain-containing protein [Planctomycetota bacterium]|nr:FHA domain-containing protein [Planctomycetota bacterium]